MDSGIHFNLNRFCIVFTAWKNVTSCIFDQCYIEFDLEKLLQDIHNKIFKEKSNRLGSLRLKQHTIITY